MKVAAATPAVPGKMPPDIAAALREIGPKIEGKRTTEIYAPLHPKEPYQNVTVTRTCPTARTSATCSTSLLRLIRRRRAVSLSSSSSTAVDFLLAPSMRRTHRSTTTSGCGPRRTASWA